MRWATVTHGLGPRTAPGISPPPCPCLAQPLTAPGEGDSWSSPGAGQGVDSDLMAAKLVSLQLSSSVAGTLEVFPHSWNMERWGGVFTPAGPHLSEQATHVPAQAASLVFSQSVSPSLTPEARWGGSGDSEGGPAVLGWSGDSSGGPAGRGVFLGGNSEANLEVQGWQRGTRVGGRRGGSTPEFCS